MTDLEPDLDPRRIAEDRAKAEEALQSQRDFQVRGTNPGFVGRAVGRFFKFVAVIVGLLILGLVVAKATGNLEAILGSF